MHYDVGKCCTTSNHDVHMHNTSTESVNRTHTRRRRKSLKDTPRISSSRDSHQQQQCTDENLSAEYRILDKCVICRHSECIGVDCVMGNTPRHTAAAMQSMKNDQFKSTPLADIPSFTSNIASRKLHHRHHHQGQQHHQQQQQQQQNNAYIESTGHQLTCTTPSPTNTSSISSSSSSLLSLSLSSSSSPSPSLLPSPSPSPSVKNDRKLPNIRWWKLPMLSLSVFMKPKYLPSNCSRKFKMWRTFVKRFSQFLMWFAISLFLVNFSINLIISGAYANEIKPKLQSSGKVCPSMDIRNHPSEFSNLSDCSVIEGFLIISLMDKYSAQDYETRSFPLLTEITDYMMIYRVNGLKTLGKLFPNLSVIRGNQLFEGYSLVIYENIHLEELALVSLTTIIRGAVRIEKNPLLCFVETINWAQIMVSNTAEDHFFRNNKNNNECPVCPGGYKNKDASQLEEGPSCQEFPGGQRYCWNRQNCQKLCPSRCKNYCNERGECCHEACLGGCARNDVNSCSVCKRLVWKNECRDTCPNNFYKYLNRSCISESDCFNKAPPLNQDMRHEYPYVPFRGDCSTQCPAGFEKHNNRTCRQCDDKCVKKCPSTTIDSISDAKRLRGCTVISGWLVISIRQGGPHIMEELEKQLNTIEEIEGYLKVTRSFSLLSLSFLKGLKVIKGTELDSNKYALYVLDNQNLQNIWGDNQTVKIETGRLFFHFNPKLCYYKIEKLLTSMVDNRTLDKSEVATDSNGDRGSCNITILNVTITQIGPRNVMVRVQPMQFEDDRGFIGYQYYYIEAPFKNVSIYDSRHGCGNDGWNLDDENTKETTHMFSHLKPFTQYAFYVKTYTISTETNNGQSNITYFRTLPDKPDAVRNLRSAANSSSEVIIKWSPPRVANGNLTTYVIKATLTVDDPKLLDQRNYCAEPIKPTFDIPPIITGTGKETAVTDKDSKDCLCDESEGTHGTKPAPKVEEEVVVNEINFEDAIQNFIYIKREDLDKEPNNVRRKRDVENTSPQTTTLSTVKLLNATEIQKINISSDNEELTQSVKMGKYFTYVYEIVNTSVTEVILKDLKHYSRYAISIKACREGRDRDRCSNEAITYPRTLKLASADNVKNMIAEVEATNTSRSNVRLRWDPPIDPNSLIVSYSIKYARADIEHAKGFDKCITQKEYRNLTGVYVLKNLDSGNYSVQIMATSLAGDGNYTSPIYFYIPETGMSWQLITAIVVMFIILCVLVGIVWYVRKKYYAPSPDLKLFTSVNPEYISMQYTQDEWEISRDQIIQLGELGQGSFGMVYEGIIKNLNKKDEDTPCAIKTVNENATDRERINFLQEASVMKQFDTHHVVRLLGVVSRGQPVLVVMELMKNGDLKAYLRSHRPDAESFKAGEDPPQPPTLKRILQMAIEIADGMAYLSAKKFVHRDLAARNCMVATDLTVKIGDFGMTRDIYETDYYRKGTKGLLPVRWMAPESLKDGVFSSATDVFSYGVVLWEMATLASQPYQGLSNDQVLRYVIDGGVMERPENCPDKLYNLMRKCWQHRPTARPSFMDIIQSLLEDADPTFKDVSFYHSPEGQDVLVQMQPAADIDDVTTPLRAGDDDFKMEIEDNYLNNSRHSRRSHLSEEGQPRSPYSLGSADLISSTPDGVSSLKRSNPNSLASSLNKTKQDNNKSTEGTIATGTVQNFFSNSLGLAPRSRRMEFLRNAFLGNGNSSRSNNNSNSNSVTRIGGNVGDNNSKAVNANAYDYSENNRNMRKSSKDYLTLNESIASDDVIVTHPLDYPVSPNEQLSLPSSSLDKRTQQPIKQCNDNDFKVTNSRSNNSNISHTSDSSNNYKEKNSTTASSYHPHQILQNQRQQQQQQQQQSPPPPQQQQPPPPYHKYHFPKENVSQWSTHTPNGFISGNPQGNQSFSQDIYEGSPEEQKLITKSQK